MALTLVTITGRVPLPDDSVPETAEIVFTLSGFDTEGDAAALPIQRAFELVNGALPDPVSLWVNTQGLRGTYYTVTVNVVDPQTGRVTSYPLSNIQITTNTSPQTLVDLLNNPVPASPGWNINLNPVEYQALLDDVAANKAAIAGLGALATRDTVGPAQIDADAVGNAQMAHVPSGTLKGRINEEVGTPADLTAQQVRNILDVEEGAQPTGTNEVSTAIGSAPSGALGDLGLLDTLAVKLAGAGGALYKVSLGTLINYVSNAIDAAQMAYDVLIKGDGNKPILRIDPAGNLTASALRILKEGVPRAPAVPVIEQSETRDQGPLIRATPDGVDLALSRATLEAAHGRQAIIPADYPVIPTGAPRIVDGVTVQPVSWAGVTFEAALNRFGDLMQYRPDKIRVVLALGQSDQALGGTGRWSIESLCPTHSFIHASEWTSRFRGVKAAGFGDLATNGFGDYTATGITPLRNPDSNQSVADGLAARLTLENCRAFGKSDVFVAFNIAAGGATIDQTTDAAGEDIWNNILLAMDQCANIEAATGIPTEIYAIDWRQGYGDRNDDATASYLAKLIQLEEDLWTEIQARVPSQTRRPWFVVQQVAEATIDVATTNYGEGPALAQMQFARANTHGNVIYPNPTVDMPWEEVAAHMSERTYVANGEEAALHILAAENNIDLRSAFPVSDTGVLVGDTFTYRLSAPKPLTVDLDKLAGFTVRSGNGVTVADAQLFHVGMSGGRLLYDVALTFSAVPTGFEFVVHAADVNDGPYTSGMAALREAAPMDLYFASDRWNTNRPAWNEADFSTETPPTGPLLHNVGLHKITE